MITLPQFQDLSARLNETTRQLRDINSFLRSAQSEWPKDRFWIGLHCRGADDNDELTCEWGDEIAEAVIETVNEIKATITQRRAELKAQLGILDEPGDEIPF